MRYVVVWANRPEFNPGEGYLPLEVKGHLNAHYWYQQLESAVANETQVGGVPTRLFTHFHTNDEVSVRWGGCVVNSPSLHELQVMVAGLRWDEGPTNTTGTK
jgi:hypothetical protein